MSEAPAAPTPRTGTPTPKADAVAIGLAGGASLIALGFSRLPETILGANRSIGDDTGPSGLVMQALAAFVVVVTIAWIAKRRGKERSWPLVALAPAIMFITWIAGAHKLQMNASKATPDLGLGDRIAELLLANALAADFWLVGGLLALIALTASSLVFAYRARARATERTLDGVRIASIIVGSAILIGVVMLLATTRHFGPQSLSARPKAMLALVPSVLGVAAIFIGAGSLRHGPRAEVSRDIASSAMAACFAVILCGPLLMIAGSSDVTGNIGPEQVERLFKELIAEGPWWVIYTLPFLAPILGAWLIARGDRPRRAPAAIVLASGVITVAMTLLAYGRLRRAMDEIVLVPQNIVSTPIVVGSVDDCGLLPESRLVHVTKTRVATKTKGAAAIDVPFASDGTCKEVVKAIDELGKTDAVWLSVDPDAPFSNVSCILDELSRIRPTRIVPRATSQSSARTQLTWGSRHTVTPQHSFKGCDVHLAGKKNGALTCKALVLADPRCDGRFTFDREDQEKVFEIVLSSDDSPTPVIRWTQGGTVIAEFIIGPRARPLADVMVSEWKNQGSHRDPADRRFDTAIVRSLPATPFRDVEQALATLDTVLRPVNLYGGRVVETPAFGDVAIGSLGFPRLLMTDSMLPPFMVSIDAKAAEKSTARDAMVMARRMCWWGGCSPRVHAQLEWAEIATSSKSLDDNEGQRREATWALTRARMIDPTMPMPNLDSLKTPLPRLRVEPRADVTVVDADGIDRATLQRFVDDRQPMLYACAMGLSLSKPPDVLEGDIKLHLTRRGRVSGGGALAPDKDKNKDFSRSGTLRCILGSLRGAELAPPSPLTREAEPVLHIHIVTPKL